MLQPAMQNDRASFKATIVAWTLGALLMIYFLFPFALVVPIMLVASSKSSEAPKFVGIIFAPVFYLAHQMPIYNALVEKEGELMEEAFPGVIPW